MGKRFTTLILTAAFTGITCMTALAGQWEQAGSGWRYTDNGTYLTGWQWIDGNNDGVAECYYFDSNGYMLADTTTPDGYTVDASGAWVVDGVVQTQETAKGNRYTLGINDVIWDLMNHTREENQAKYGQEVNGRYPGLPYRVIYLRQTTMTSDLMTEKPYRVDLHLEDGELTKAFMDAPNPEHHDIYSAAEELRGKGYDAEVRKVYPLGVYTCQLDIDRFVVRIRYGTVTSVSIQQEMDEETGTLVNKLFNSPTSVGNIDGNEDDTQIIRAN